MTESRPPSPGLPSPGLPSPGLPLPRSLAERLQVKRNRRLAVIGAPAGLEATLAVPRAPPELAEVALLFVADRAAFDAGVPALAATIRPDAILWVAYPKLTSPLARDLGRDILHAAAPAHGLDTVAQIAVDGDWSALRLKRA